VAVLVHGGDDPDRDGHLTRTRYDTRGNALALIDEHGRTAFESAYDLADRVLCTDSIDAGWHVSVVDAAGNLVHSWDSRGCATLCSYDGANRLTAVHAREVPGAAVTQRELLTYGDEDPDRAEALQTHRLGRVWRHLDEAGLQVAEVYDFTGRLTSHTRLVVSDTAIAAAEPDGWTANWAAPGADAALEPVDSTLRTRTRYDALGRAVEITPPVQADGQPARIVATYGRSGALRSVTVNGVPSPCT
jgi:insecticidal toxin complex protein TccC